MAGSRSALAAALLTALVALPARAASTKTFIALLNGGQETPPTTSKSLGVALLTFNEQSKTLCYSISYDRLDAAEIAAHLHGPGAPGVSAAILFGLTAANPKVGCTPPLDGKQKKDLKKGLLYVNIHSTMWPDGEIRGQVLPIGR